MARFDNKVVLVSGGARGQGAAEARLLVAQGAKVVIGDVRDNQGQALAGELGPAASFPARCGLGSRLGPRRRSRPEARRLARPRQQRRDLPARRADGDRRRALAAAHPDQPVRLLPRHEGGSAGNGVLGRRVHREYLVSCRPQGLARVLRLCRDQMGAAGHDHG